MTFNEQQRIQLHQAIGRQIGEEMAGVLMSSLPPFDWNQIATKDDLKVFATRDEMDVKFAEIRVEMADLRTETRTGLADLRTEMANNRAEIRVEMADLRTETRTGMADLRAELHKSLRANTTALIGINIAVGSLLLGIPQFFGR